MPMDWASVIGQGISAAGQFGAAYMQARAAPRMTAAQGGGAAMMGGAMMQAPSGSGMRVMEPVASVESMEGPSELTTLAYLLHGVANGANDVWVRQEARLKRFTRGDFNKLTSMQTTFMPLQHLMSQHLDRNGLMMALNFIEEALGAGSRGRRRGIGTKTMLKALKAAGRLAKELRRAGGSIAALARPRQEKGRRK